MCSSWRWREGPLSIHGNRPGHWGLWKVFPGSFGSETPSCLRVGRDEREKKAGDGCPGGTQSNWLGDLDLMMQAPDIGRYDRATTTSAECRALSPSLGPRQEMVSGSLAKRRSRPGLAYVGKADPLCSIVACMCAGNTQQHCYASSFFLFKAVLQESEALTRGPTAHPF